MTLFTGDVRAPAQSRLFFFHNPKAGGLALRRILASIYTPDRLFVAEQRLIELHAARVDGCYQSLAGFDVYMGHFGYDLFRAVEAGHQPITNFRHPAARLVSLYNFYRHMVHVTPEELASPEYYAVKLARSSSFEEFVLCDDPRVAIHTCDFHFRQLANTPSLMVCERSESDVESLVQSMPWFYVCEFPEISYVWARQVFGWNLQQILRDNITLSGRDSASILGMSESLRRQIMTRNARDLAIYRLAVDRLIALSASRLSDAPLLAAE